MKASSRILVAALVAAVFFTLRSLDTNLPPRVSSHLATQDRYNHEDTNIHSTDITTDTNEDTIFLMIKTGATEMYKKVPMHLVTTAKTFPQFAIYSDASGSIGGYPVIDALANLTLYDDSEQYPPEDAFNTYQTLRNWRNKTLSTVDFTASNVSAKLSWQLDRFKNLPMLHHAYINAPATTDWFLFIDADTFVSRPSLESFIKRFDDPRNTPHYVGSPIPAYPLHFAHGGAGVLISRNALDITFGRHENLLQEIEQSTKGSCCGDLMVGFMLRQYANMTVSTGFHLDNATKADDAANTKGSRLSAFQGNSFWDVEVTADNMCAPLVSFHHVTPSDIEVLWQYEQSRNGDAILHRDIYLDFYRDNLPESAPSWDNSASDVVYEDWTGTKSECAAKCMHDFKCLGWRFKPGYCALGYSVRLGRFDPAFESGNIQDRIAPLDSISC